MSKKSKKSKNKNKKCGNGRTITSKGKNADPLICGIAKDFEITASTYANIITHVSADNYDWCGGCVESVLYTVEQAIFGDVWSRMRVISQEYISEDNLERLELIAIFKAIKCLPEECVVNVNVSSAAVKQAIDGFRNSDKANYPNADLLYPIFAVNCFLEVTVCPNANTCMPLTDFNYERSIKGVLEEKFHEYMVNDLKGNAGLYTLKTRSGKEYIYDMAMPVHRYGPISLFCIED